MIYWLFEGFLGHICSDYLYQADSLNHAQCASAPLIFTMC